MMRGQNLRATTPSGAGLRTNGPATPFVNEPRTPAASRWQRAPDTPARTPAMTRPFRGMNAQNGRGRGRGRSRLSPRKMGTIEEWVQFTGMGCVLFPNPGSVNGSPMNTNPVVIPMDQLSHIHRVQMGINAGMNNMNNMMHVNQPSPYMVNPGFPMMPVNQQGPWAENMVPMQQPFPSPYDPNMRTSPLAGYGPSNMSQGMEAYPQVDIWRTSGGYRPCDMKAITQSEPRIPFAVPAMGVNPAQQNLARCLENREGISNVYIRGFLPETTDEMLHGYAARFGEIERCKAIVDLDTGLCKGFGFVQFYSFEAAENCIRGFFSLGYQASYAQKSRNSRLKELEDKSSTNIYCTNLPAHWTEADLRRHFEPYRVVSEKINRDEATGVSKEVGFARFETREIAEKVLAEFHNVTAGIDNVKLLLRFADTKAQKALKQQSNRRRAYRAEEYNYVVGVNGLTPSPDARRVQRSSAQITPVSQQTMDGAHLTPATTISPNCTKAGGSSEHKAVPLTALENTRIYQDGFHRRSMTEITSSSLTALADSSALETQSYISPDEPRKVRRIPSMSP